MSVVSSPDSKGAEPDFERPNTDLRELMTLVVGVSEALDLCSLPLPPLILDLSHFLLGEGLQILESVLLGDGARILLPLLEYFLYSLVFIVKPVLVFPTLGVKGRLFCLCYHFSEL